MTRHRRVEVGTWRDRKFRQLSMQPPSARTLWLYLLCGPRTTIFPGLVTATESIVADDLGWTVADLRPRWEEIHGLDMAIADWEAGIIILPRALLDRSGVPRETSKPGSPNAFRGWAKAWGDIPDCDLRDEYLSHLASFAAVLGKPYVEVFVEHFPTPLERVAEQSESGLEPARARGRGPVPDPVLLDQGTSSGIESLPKGGRGGDLIRGQDVPAMVERRRLIGVFVERVNRARIDLSAELGLSGVRPIALMGEGERALMQRLKESADPAADMDHVIEVAIVEARASRELRWLGWSLAEPKAWRTKLATTPAEARRPPRGSNGSSVFSALDRAAEDLKERGVVIADAGREDDHDD